MSFMNNVRLLEMSKKQLQTKRGSWQVLLHNDNHNTFDHVVNCLMDICQHGFIQSAQCAQIVHVVGKCNIYVDSFDECNAVMEELKEHGLNVTISKYKKNV